MRRARSFDLFDSFRACDVSATVGAVVANMTTAKLLAPLLFASLFVCLRAAAAEAEVKPRRPVALAACGDQLVVATRDAGALIVVDIPTRRVVSESIVGRRISHVAAGFSPGELFAVDESAHQLLRLKLARESAEDSVKLTVVERASVAKYPVALAVDVARRRLAVSGLWSRRVTMVECKASGENAGDSATMMLRPVASIDVSFAPRHCLFLPDGRLVVADAFGGGLAVIDGDRRFVTQAARVQGHNLGGLALSLDGRNLMISQQTLSGSETTTEDPVFWGQLLNNSLRTVSLDELPRDGSSLDEPVRGTVLPLGEPSHGTGDPSAIWVGSRGQTVVCLSGVDQVAVRDTETLPMLRLDVGRRPVAVAVDRAEATAFIALQFDAALDMIDLKTRRVVGRISLDAGSKREPTLVEQGEVLFHDARLSLDGWFSCHSCHVDGHSNHLVNDNLGDDSFGAPKRVPSLLGAGRTGPWAWNGRQSHLDQQIGKSIRMTMRGDERVATEKNAAALAAYVATLQPAPSLAAARDQLDEPKIAEGRRTFERLGCADCHSGREYTRPGAFDVGLADERGERRFNPPSLLGVSQRDALFHDGRARSLEEVVGKFKHAEIDVPESDRPALLAFLRSL